MNFNELFKNLDFFTLFFFKYSGPKFSHDAEAKRKQKIAETE